MQQVRFPALEEVDPETSKPAGRMGGGQQLQVDRFALIREAVLPTGADARRLR